MRVTVVESAREWWSLGEAEFRNLKDGEAGPFLLPQGTHRVYVEGENWTMGSFKTVEPSPGVDERVDLEVDLVEASVLVEFEGVLARNRKFHRLDSETDSRTLGEIECDGEGRATVRLPRGEIVVYRSTSGECAARSCARCNGRQATGVSAAGHLGHDGHRVERRDSPIPKIATCPRC